MNWKAVPYKRRKHPAIDATAQRFSDALHDGNCELAARLVFWCALQMLGVKGLISSLDHANRVIIRKKYRSVM